MSSLFIPRVYEVVEILEGPLKGTQASVSIVEYDYVCFEYWEPEVVLEPGIYREYAGITVAGPNNVPYYVPKGEFKVLGTFEEMVSEHKGTRVDLVNAVIPYRPLRERTLFEGDQIIVKDFKEPLEVVELNYAVTLFPGHYARNKPFLTVQGVKNGQLFAVRLNESFTFHKEGPMRKAFMKDNKDCSEVELMSKVRAGAFSPKVFDGIGNIYLDREQALSYQLQDNELLFPSTMLGDRFVVFDCGTSISPEKLKNLRDML